MPTLRPVLAVVIGVLLVAGLSVAAFVPSAPDSPVPLPVAAPTTSTPAAPGSADPPSDPPEPDPDLLRSALLRPTEVGPGWELAPDQPAPDASVPSPCGGRGVVARFPDADRIGVALQSDGGERAQETLSVFADEATAGRAFDVYAEGLECRSGRLGSTPVEISQPEDVRSRVRGDQATSWTLTGDGFSAVLVSAVTEDRLVNFVFFTPDGSSLTRLDALALARTGVARLQAT